VRYADRIKLSYQLEAIRGEQPYILNIGRMLLSIAHSRQPYPLLSQHLHRLQQAKYPFSVSSVLAPLIKGARSLFSLWVGL